MCVCVYIYIYMYTYIHVYIYIYSYNNNNKNNSYLTRIASFSDLTLTVQNDLRRNVYYELRIIVLPCVYAD